MPEWFSALSSPVQAALIGASTTVLTSLLGFAAIVWQIGRQGRNAIRQNKLNEAEKLKLDIYRSILETCERASDAEIALASYLRNFLLETKTASSMHALGVQFNVPSARFLEFSRLRQKAVEGAIALITVVERWHVIDPRMAVFIDAINAAIFDVSEASETAFQQAAIHLMPMNKIGSADEVLPWKPPSSEDVDRFKAQAEELFEALSTLSSYVFDFQVEMQALLVGGLFDKPVTVRQPIDPSVKVIRLKHERELRRYFRDETRWGKATGRLMTDVAAQYSLPEGMTPFGIQIVKERAVYALGMLRKLRRQR